MRHTHPRHRRDPRQGRRGLPAGQQGVRLRPSHADPQLASSARSSRSRCPGIVLFRDLAPADDPNELLRHTMWEEGTAPHQRPDRPPDQGVRRHDRLRVPRHPRRPPRLGAHARGEGEGRRPPHAPRPEGPQPRRRATRTGATTASSRTPRSAPTSDAPSRSTSSRRTTCCAPATSRPSTSRTTARSSSDRPSAPSPSCRSRSTTTATWLRRATSTSLSDRRFWERER